MWRKILNLQEYFICRKEIFKFIYLFIYATNMCQRLIVYQSICAFETNSVIKYTHSIIVLEDVTFRRWCILPPGPVNRVDRITHNQTPMGEWTSKQFKKMVCLQNYPLVTVQWYLIIKEVSDLRTCGWGL